MAFTANEVGPCIIFYLGANKLIARHDGLHGLGIGGSHWNAGTNDDQDDDVDDELEEDGIHHDEPVPIWKDYSLTNDDLKDYEKKRRLELIMSAYAISVSINFLVSLSLLAGVKLERRWLLLPWVAWTSLSLIVSQMMVFYAPHHNRVREGETSSSI